MASGHGGTRTGAGRPRKYARELAAVQVRIVEAPPAVVDRLVTTAQAGDTQAAAVLLDHAPPPGARREPVA